MFSEIINTKEMLKQTSYDNQKLVSLTQKAIQIRTKLSATSQSCFCLTKYSDMYTFLVYSTCCCSDRCCHLQKMLESKLFGYLPSCSETFNAKNWSKLDLYA